MAEPEGKGDNMCSLVEIKNPNEIYIHYLSQDTSNDKNIVNITHITKSVDDECKPNDDNDETSDRGSSMESAVDESVEIVEKVDVTVNSLTILPIEVHVETCEMATQVEPESLRGKETGI